MPNWDSINDDIRSRLPEYWKSDIFLEPVNRYTQELSIQMLANLLSNLGVVRPIQVWKTLPEEYHWEHKYFHTADPYLYYRKKEKSSGYTTTQELAPLIVREETDEWIQTLCARIPNTKRNCHAVIHIELDGSPDNKIEKIDEFKIKNAGQVITFKKIYNRTSIDILTEDGIILVDGVQNNDIVTGMFNKIRPQADNPNFDEVDIYDENKITQLEFETTQSVTIKLSIKLLDPVYVTEQNIRLASVSAFPIESVKLYGFFCHEFNNKQEWRFLWEKKYSLNERVTYDRITKQFDCERFYVQVKFHGIGNYLLEGFPKEQYNSNPVFNIDTKLDYWGKYFGLPRRHYKPHISEDEEPFTYPKYYPYEIEQDYWYEERLVNEYRSELEPINAMYIKDTDFNNVAILEVIDPAIQDLWAYVETIKPTIDNEHETDNILPYSCSQDGDGRTWTNPAAITSTNISTASVMLEPQTSESFNDKSYMSKVLKLKFKIPELPKNIIIKGMELTFNGLTDLHSDTLFLDDRTVLKLPFDIVKDNGDVSRRIEVCKINHYTEQWQKGKGTYKFGGKTDLFGLDKIEKYQIKDEVNFEIGFTNIHNFLLTNIELYNIKFKIYFDIIEDTYDIKVKFDKREMVIVNNDSINITIDLKNTGELPIVDKTIFIAVPPELKIDNDTFNFNLDVEESFTIGNKTDDKIQIKLPDPENAVAGMFDVIVFCDDKVIKNEILVRRGKA